MTAYLANTPVLETERLTLRAPRLEDFEPWFAFARSPRAEHIGGFDTLATAWRGFAHFAGQWALRGYGSFIFCHKGSDAPLGVTGPWHPAESPEKELGWSVWVDAAEGKGLTFEAAIAARAYAYESLGWTTAVSYIARTNHRSIALAERMGARPDPRAALPEGYDDTVVYRHPAPEALQ